MREGETGRELGTERAGGGSERATVERCKERETGGIRMMGERERHGGEGAKREVRERDRRSVIERHWREREIQGERRGRERERERGERERRGRERDGDRETGRERQTGEREGDRVRERQIETGVRERKRGER